MYKKYREETGKMNDCGRTDICNFEYVICEVMNVPPYSEHPIKWLQYFYNYPNRKTREHIIKYINKYYLSKVKGAKNENTPNK